MTAGLAALLVLGGSQFVSAFTGPGTLAPGTGTSSVSIDSNGNVVLSNGLCLNGSCQASWPVVSSSTTSTIAVSSNGYVGIGTTTPSSLLTVAGSGYFTGNLTVNGALTSGSSATAVNAAYVSSGVFGSLSTKGNYSFQDAATTSTVLYIDATNDRVGIGTASPTGLLDVTNSTINDTQLKMINTNTASGNVGLELRGHATSSQEYIDFTNGSTNDTGAGTPDYTNRIISNSNGLEFIGGNVGIATATPGFTLEVAGTAALTTLVGRTSTQAANDTLYFGVPGQNFFLDRSGTGGGQFIFGYNTAKVTTQQSRFQVYNNATDHQVMFEVDSAGSSSGVNEVLFPTGNVGIGTAAPADKLDVGGVGPGTAAVYGSVVSGVGVYGISSGSSNVLTSNGIGVFGNATYDFSGSHGEYTSGGTWTNGSSRTIKENFTPVDSASILGKINQLPITQWNYKSDKKALHIGPVAEDFYSIFGLGDDNKSISTVDPSGIALVGIQAQQKEIDALKSTVESQQNEINELKSEIEQLKQSHP